MFAKQRNKGIFAKALRDDRDLETLRSNARIYAVMNAQEMLRDRYAKNNPEEGHRRARIASSNLTPYERDVFLRNLSHGIRPYRF